MKNFIAEFEQLQRKTLGFVRYVTRGSKDGYAIDVYTSTGLLITTKLSYQSEEAVRKFVVNYTKYLYTIQEES